MSAVVTSTAPFVTDERLAHLAPWAPLLIAGLLVLACLWADFGKPWTVDEEDAAEHAPPIASELGTLEVRRRAAGHG